MKAKKKKVDVYEADEMGVDLEVSNTGVGAVSFFKFTFLCQQLLCFFTTILAPNQSVGSF